MSSFVVPAQQIAALALLIGPKDNAAARRVAALLLTANWNAVLNDYPHTGPDNWVEGGIAAHVPQALALVDDWDSLDLWSALGADRVIGLVNSLAYQLGGGLSLTGNTRQWIEDSFAFLCDEARTKGDMHHGLYGRHDQGWTWQPTDDATIQDALDSAILDSAL
jgi:hypothetical protein